MCPRPPCPSTPPTTPTRQPVPAGAEARTCSALQTPADPAPSVPTHVLVSLGEHVGPETLRAPDASRSSRRLSPGPLGAAPSRKELILLPERPSRQHFQSLLFSSKCGVAPILPPARPRGSPRRRRLPHPHAVPRCSELSRSTDLCRHLSPEFPIAIGRLCPRPLPPPAKPLCQRGPDGT